MPPGNNLSDLFLHVYNKQIYFINRASADIYEFEPDKDRVVPVLKL